MVKGDQVLQLFGLNLGDLEGRGFVLFEAYDSMFSYYDGPAKFALVVQEMLSKGSTLFGFRALEFDSPLIAGLSHPSPLSAAAIPSRLRFQ
jgi:hypothetical protein